MTVNKITAVRKVQRRVENETSPLSCIVNVRKEKKQVS